MQPPNARRVLVSVAEAAVRLGISETEVRRRVTAGRLEAEKFDRPQGSYIRVVFQETEDAPSPAVPESEPTRQDAPSAYAEVLLKTLDDLAVAREQVAELREERGRLLAERDAAVNASDDARTRLAASEAREAALTAEIGKLRAELERATRRPWWQVWPW